MTHVRDISLNLIYLFGVIIKYNLINTGTPSDNCLLYEGVTFMMLAMCYSYCIKYSLNYIVSNDTIAQAL